MIYFCPGCNRKCDVLVTQKNGKVISVTDNNCSIGDGHARFQYETDTRANG